MANTVRPPVQEVFTDPVSNHTIAPLGTVLKYGTNYYILTVLGWVTTNNYILKNECPNPGVQQLFDDFSTTLGSDSKWVASTIGASSTASTANGILNLTAIQDGGFGYSQILCNTDFSINLFDDDWTIVAHNLTMDITQDGLGHSTEIGFSDLSDIRLLTLRTIDSDPVLQLAVYGFSSNEFLETGITLDAGAHNYVVTHYAKSNVIMVQVDDTVQQVTTTLLDSSFDAQIPIVYAKTSGAHDTTLTLDDVAYNGRSIWKEVIPQATNDYLPKATATGANVVAFGPGASVTAASGTAIGASATAADNALALGHSATAATGSIALGDSASAATGENQVGSAAFPIDTLKVNGSNTPALLLDVAGENGGIRYNQVVHKLQTQDNGGTWWNVQISDWFAKQKKFLETVALPGIDDYAEFRDDFETTNSWTSTNTGTGSGISAFRTDPGGTCSMASGVTNGGINETYTTLYNTWFNGGATSKWFLAVRFALITTPDAQTTAVAGGQEVANVGTGATPELAVGVIGGTSTTNFVAQYTGAGTTTLTSTVAIDTNMHTFQLWMDGSNVYFSVDGETPVSDVVTNLPTNPQALYFLTANGTTSANQQIKIDSIYAATERI